MLGVTVEELPAGEIISFPLDVPDPSFMGPF
jgi:hypothetical protein